MSYQQGPLRVFRFVSHGALRINVWVTHRDAKGVCYKMNNDDDSPGEYTKPCEEFDKTYSRAA